MQQPGWSGAVGFGSLAQGRAGEKGRRIIAKGLPQVKEATALVEPIVENGAENSFVLCALLAEYAASIILAKTCCDREFPSSFPHPHAMHRGLLDQHQR